MFLVTSGQISVFGYVGISNKWTSFLKLTGEYSREGWIWVDMFLLLLFGGANTKAKEADLPFPRKVSKIGSMLHLPLEMTSCYSSINWHVCRNIKWLNAYIYRRNLGCCTSQKTVTTSNIYSRGSPFKLYFALLLAWEASLIVYMYININIYKYIYIMESKDTQKCICINIHIKIYASLCLVWKSSFPHSSVQQKVAAPDNEKI